MRFLLVFFTALMGLGQVAFAQNAEPICAPTPSHHAVRILGDEQKLPYVAGDQNFYQTLKNGWVFALMRIENGWSVRLYEGEPVGDAVDLTALTPPLRGAPNPRDINGWHFRNADNTGPNTGDVNAPQEMRAFVISPALAGTGGWKPAGDEAPAPHPGDGIGWLRIIDYGLANPRPGTRARMNYLQFDACLSWPRGDDERDHLLDAARLDFTAEDVEVYGKCGLDLDRYALAAPFAPRQIAGDFDGDDAGDLITRVRRNRDAELGLATCRAGSWNEIFGFETYEGLRGGFIGEMEAWTLIDPASEVPRQISGFDLPISDGPMILLERIEKEAILLFWRDGAWRTKRLFGRVEP